MVLVIIIVQVRPLLSEREPCLAFLLELAKDRSRDYSEMWHVESD